MSSVEEAYGVHFITMELVRGKTLADAVPKSGFGVEPFFDLALGFTEAVEAVPTVRVSSLGIGSLPEHLGNGDIHMT